MVLNCWLKVLGGELEREMWRVSQECGLGFRVQVVQRIIKYPIGFGTFSANLNLLIIFYKLEIFLWLALQGKALSNEQRLRRESTLDPSCNFCGQHSESFLPVLRDVCPRAREVWALFLNVQSKFFLADFKPRLLRNLLSKAKWSAF